MDDMVALLAEGVDRNCSGSITSVIPSSVALLAEGVDRNGLIPDQDGTSPWSPSSRRAWIEMA